MPLLPVAREVFLLLWFFPLYLFSAFFPMGFGTCRYFAHVPISCVRRFHISDCSGCFSSFSLFVGLVVALLVAAASFQAACVDVVQGFSLLLVLVGHLFSRWVLVASVFFFFISLL